MEEDERAYSDEDFRRILKKAEELARESELASEPGASLSLGDMKAAAAEAGLDPALIERAAHLIPPESGGTLARRVLRRMGWMRLGATFSTPVTQERATRVLSVLRGSAGQEGKGEETPYGLVWQSDRGRFIVTMYNEGGGSRVEVSTDPLRWLALSGWLGLIGGWLMIGTVEPSSAIGFIGGVAVGIGVALGAWASITHRARKRLDALLDAVSRTMRSLAEPPADSRESADSRSDAEAGTDDDGSASDVR